MPLTKRTFDQVNPPIGETYALSTEHKPTQLLLDLAQPTPSYPARRKSWNTWRRWLGSPIRAHMSGSWAGPAPRRPSPMKCHWPTSSRQTGEDSRYCRRRSGLL